MTDHLQSPKVLSTSKLSVKERTTPDRTLWLDNVRAIACILVVVLHTAAPYLYMYGKIPQSSWQIANVIDSFSRICVPLFFMVSGYLFLGERRPKLKNLARLISALAFYTLIAVAYYGVLGGNPGKAMTEALWRPAFYHLWFLYALLGIYLIAMLIQVREIGFTALLLIGFTLFVLLNPRTGLLFESSGVTTNSRFSLDGTSIYYLLFAVLGALAGRVRFPSDRRVGIVAVATVIVSGCLIAGLTYAGTRSGGKFEDRFYEYASPLVFASALATFILIRQTGPFPGSVQRCLSLVAQLSLPIYGLHAMILGALRRFGMRDFSNAIVEIPMTFFITMVISVALAWIVHLADRRRLVS